MNNTTQLDGFSKNEIQALHDEMNDGGKLDFLFTSRLIVDEKDTSLNEVTKDDLLNGGLTEQEAILFLCAVAASRGDFKDTQNTLFWAAK